MTDAARIREIQERIRGIQDRLGPLMEERARDCESGMFRLAPDIARYIAEPAAREIAILTAEIERLAAKSDVEMLLVKAALREKIAAIIEDTFLGTRQEPHYKSSRLAADAILALIEPL